MKTSSAVENVQVDPKIPEGLWSTPNEKRPADHLAFWGKPFIQSSANPHFPSGRRFDVYCLDGGAADRPTCWGMFGTLEEAAQRAQDGPPWGDYSFSVGRMQHGPGW